MLQNIQGMNTTYIHLFRRHGNTDILILFFFRLRRNMMLYSIWGFPVNT